jgi:hypothetical protein
MMESLCVHRAIAFLLAQASAIEVVSVKPSRVRSGGDGTITINPARLSAKNVTLKHLVFEDSQNAAVETRVIDAAERPTTQN